MMISKLGFFLATFSVRTIVASAATSLCPDVPSNGCSICGNGQCVGNPDAIFLMDGQSEITCGELQADGLAGKIDLPRCFLLELEIDVCQCHRGPSIFDIISNDDRFNTLKDILEQTSLDNSLDGENVLTVFAPSDDAFDNLPEAYLDELTAGGIDAFSQLLVYHVVPELLKRDQMKDGIVKSLNNSIIQIDVKREEVEINGVAKVNEFDILARNGVIHVIDEVLIPPPNLYDLAQKDDRLETFVTLIQQAGLVQTLLAGDITIFAPSNLALNETDTGDDIDDLKNLLLYHIVESPFLRQDLKDSKEDTLLTVQGEILHYHFVMDHIFDFWNNELMINDSTVIAADLFASNGIIHIIDKVLSPPSPTLTPSDSPTMEPTDEPTTTPSTQPSTQLPTPPHPGCGPGEYGCPDTPEPTHRPTRPPTRHPISSPSKCAPGEYGCPETPNPTRRPTYPPTRPPSRPPTRPNCGPGEYGCPDTPGPTHRPTRPPTPNPTRRPTYPPTPPPSRPPTRHPTSSPSKCAPGEYGCPETPNPTRRPTYPPTRRPYRPPTRHPTSSPSKCAPGEYGCPETPNPTRRPTYPPTRPPSRPPTRHPTCAPGDYGCPDTPQPTLRTTSAPTESPPTRPPTRSPTETPTSSPSRFLSTSPTSYPTAQPFEFDGSCPEVLPGGCSVCGDGKCVGNPDTIFAFPDQPPITCGFLEEAGVTGAIPPTQCSLIPFVIEDLCGCHDGSSVPPALPATPEPTFTNPPTPFPTPENIPLSMPTLNPTSSTPPTIEPTTIAPTPPPTLEPANPPLQDCPEIPTGGCSVCGDGKCVGNPDGIFKFPGQPAVQCDILEIAGLQGSIDLGQCGFLPGLVNDVCGCQP